MEGNGGAVVYPKDIFSMEIVTQRGHETARRCGTLLGAYIRQLPVTDTGDGVITVRQAQQGWGCATKSPIRAEYKDFGVHLVDDHEWHAEIVT
jgi:hypothetical protein